MGNVQSSLPTYYNADPTNEAYTHSLSGYVDLASAAIGARVIRASNEKFGAAANLIKPQAPAETSGKADAWVTRRHNPEADWAVVRLGSAGTIAGFDIDTRTLDGVHASQISLQGCLAPDSAAVDGNGDVEGAEWEELLPEVDISANSHHLLAFWTATPTPFNFVRITLHPDGGIARLRVLGTVVADPEAEGEVDLASVNAGARVVGASDEKLGAKENLILPGRATSAMRETMGWKTQRSRTEDHNDWAVVRLGEPGFLTRIELDTLLFDGDQPVSAAVQACYTEAENPERDPECFWYQIVPRTEINANKLHKIDVTLNDVPFSHIKLVIHPDGGIGRLRAFGQRVKEIEEEAAREQAEASAEAALAAEIGTDSDDTAAVIEEQPPKEAAVPVSVAKVAAAAATKAETRGSPAKKAPAKPKAVPAHIESSADEKESVGQRKKTKARNKKAKAKQEQQADSAEDQFSSHAGHLIQSLTSPVKKRTRTRSRADDDTDDASVHTMDSQAKRSRRKTKARPAAA